MFGGADAVITTDLDGEIARNSINGNVGIKPTFGYVSRYGVVTTAPSLEQVGVIGENIEIVEEVLNIIKGYDVKDSGSVDNVGADDSVRPMQKQAVLEGQTRWSAPTNRIHRRNRRSK